MKTQCSLRFLPGKKANDPPQLRPFELLSHEVVLFLCLQQRPSSGPSFGHTKTWMPFLQIVALVTWRQPALDVGSALSWYKHTTFPSASCWLLAFSSSVACAPSIFIIDSGPTDAEPPRRIWLRPIRIRLEQCLHSPVTSTLRTSPASLLEVQRHDPSQSQSTRHDHV